MTRAPELISTAQAANELGVHVRTIHRLAEAGHLRPAGKVPGRTGAYLFDPETVEAYRRSLVEHAAVDDQLPMAVGRGGRLRLVNPKRTTPPASPAD